MKKLFILTLVTLFVSQTHADFKIKSVSKEKNMVSVDLGADANVQPGNDLTVQWRDKECTLKVSKINGNIALADGRDCEFMDKLKAGDTVTMSDFQHTGKYMETAPVSNPEVGRKKTTWESESDSDLRGFGVTLGFNTAADLKVKSTTESTFDGAGALNIGVRYITAPEYGMGFMAGLSYEFEREFDIGATNATMSLLPIELSGIFRNDKFYGFGGVNLPIVASNDGWGTSPSGQLGIQLGIGVLAIQKLSFELYYQTLNFDAGSADYARLWGAGLRAAYHF